MNIEQLSEKYIELARKNVENGLFPPNIYTFTLEKFRPINGWDEEWYRVFHGWIAILENKGWKKSYYDRDWGEINMFNFQYLYDSELPSCCSSIFTESFQDLIDIKMLVPSNCSQLAIKVNYEKYKLSNKRSSHPLLKTPS